MLLLRIGIHVKKIMKRACLKIIMGMYMKVVEKLLKEEDFIHFVDNVVGAYPGRMGSLQPTKEQLKSLFMRNQNNDAAIHK